MIAFFGSVIVALGALLIPNHTPFARIWRPSFLLALFSALGWGVTWYYFGANEVEPVVGYLFVAGMVSFLLADWLTTIMTPPSSLQFTRAFALDQLVRRREMAFLYAALSVVGTILLAYLYRERSTMFNMFDFGAALRYAEGIAKLPTYGAYHFLLFAQVLAAVLVLNPNLFLRAGGYLLFGIAVLASFVAVSRTTLFFNMSALAFLMYARKGSFRGLAIPAGTMLVLTFVYATFTGKEDVGQESFIWYYLGYAVIAFNQFILPMVDWDYGINSFGTPAMLIAGREPEDLSEMGTQYNVYSFIGSPYRDFGVYGVIALPFLFGIIWSLVWNRSGTRPFYLIMYSYMLLPCVIPFFDWKFNFTSYLYLIPLLLIFVKARFAGDDAARAPALPQGAPA